MGLHNIRRGKIENKDLDARGDGDGDFLEIGGGENEDDVGGRFLESFEEGVEGFFGEHVDFVDDVDFVFPFCRGDGGFFT